MTEPSYWVVMSLVPSAAVAVATGTQSVMSSRQMMTPQACTPVPRTLPSSWVAYSIVSLTSGLGLCFSAAKGG